MLFVLTCGYCIWSCFHEHGNNRAGSVLNPLRCRLVEAILSSFSDFFEAKLPATSERSRCCFIRWIITLIHHTKIYEVTVNLYTYSIWHMLIYGCFMLSSWAQFASGLLFQVSVAIDLCQNPMAFSVSTPHVKSDRSGWYHTEQTVGKRYWHVYISRDISWYQILYPHTCKDLVESLPWTQWV